MHCLHCGYDLRGLTEHRCPECGRQFDPGEPATFAASTQGRRFSVGRSLLGFFCILLSLLTGVIILNVVPHESSGKWINGGEEILLGSTVFVGGLVLRLIGKFRLSELFISLLLIEALIGAILILYMGSALDSFFFDWFTRASRFVFLPFLLGAIIGGRLIRLRARLTSS